MLFSASAFRGCFRFSASAFRCFRFPASCSPLCASRLLLSASCFRFRAFRFRANGRPFWQDGRFYLDVLSRRPSQSSSGRSGGAGRYRPAHSDAPPAYARRAAGLQAAVDWPTRRQTRLRPGKGSAREARDYLGEGRLQPRAFQSRHGCVPAIGSAGPLHRGSHPAPAPAGPRSGPRRGRCARPAPGRRPSDRPQRASGLCLPERPRWGPYRRDPGSCRPTATCFGPWWPAGSRSSACRRSSPADCSCRCPSPAPSAAPTPSSRWLWFTRLLPPRNPTKNASGSFHALRKNTTSTPRKWRHSGKDSSGGPPRGSYHHKCQGELPRTYSRSCQANNGRSNFRAK